MKHNFFDQVGQNNYVIVYYRNTGLVRTVMEDKIKYILKVKNQKNAKISKSVNAMQLTT